MSFEVLKMEGGRYAWQVRNDRGEIEPFRRGQIFLPRDEEAERRSHAAVQKVLADMYAEQERKAGSRA